MSATYRWPLILELDMGQCRRAEYQVHRNSMAQIQLLALRLAFFVGFSGGFTLSTSAITSLNGKGMCGIGFELVILLVSCCLLITDYLRCCSLGKGGLLSP